MRAGSIFVRFKISCATVAPRSTPPKRPTGVRTGLTIAARLMDDSLRFSDTCSHRIPGKNVGGYVELIEAPGKGRHCVVGYLLRSLSLLQHRTAMGRHH